MKPPGVGEPASRLPPKREGSVASAFRRSPSRDKWPRRSARGAASASSISGEAVGDFPGAPAWSRSGSSDGKASGCRKARAAMYSAVDAAMPGTLVSDSWSPAREGRLRERSDRARSSRGPSLEPRLRERFGRRKDDAQASRIGDRESLPEAFAQAGGSFRTRAARDRLPESGAHRHLRGSRRPERGAPDTCGRATQALGGSQMSRDGGGVRVEIEHASEARGRSAEATRAPRRGRALPAPRRAGRGARPERRSGRRAKTSSGRFQAPDLLTPGITRSARNSSRESQS